MSVVIAVAGGSGSGKTTLTALLKQKLKEDVCVLLFDNYYKRNDHMSLKERRKINYDAPEAFDTELFISHLEKLKNGEPVDCPVYDYSKHDRTQETIKLSSAEIIIVEGILVLENERVRSLCDFKIFVDTDADERILRRIERDVCERGRSLDDIILQYRTTVKPMHEKYVEPTKDFADLVVSGECIDESTVEAVLQLIEE